MVENKFTKLLREYKIKFIPNDIIEYLYSKPRHCSGSQQVRSRQNTGYGGERGVKLLLKVVSIPPVLLSKNKYSFNQKIYK